MPNKSLKRVALNWTPSTGAASHCRAGFSRRLALRYTKTSFNLASKINIWQMEINLVAGDHL